MFILRTINGRGIQANICLNKVYNLIREDDVEEFERTMLVYKDGKSYPEESLIYAFIVYNEGGDILALFRAQKNYIMMSDGKTFANLSFR